MEYTLKETSAAHEKMIRMLREDLDKAHRDNESLRSAHAKKKEVMQMLTVGLMVPPAAATGLCNIL